MLPTKWIFLQLTQMINLLLAKSYWVKYSVHNYKAGTPEPALSPTFSAPLTPLLTADTLARDSSPLLSEPNSDVFMHSSPTLSSPQIEYSVTVIGDRAGNGEANRNSDHARIDCYPTITMSSPNFTFHGDESLFSPSPPHQTTAAKRALFNDTSDEEPTSAKPVKRIRTETMSSPLRNPPAPRRATLASQKLSRKKLAAPFRSPLQTRMASTLPTTPTVLVEDDKQIVGESRPEYQTNPKSAKAAPAGSQRPIQTLVRSSRAAAQFRSPLVKVPVHASRPLVLPNQAIMDLERKLTILRRAVKLSATVTRDTWNALRRSGEMLAEKQHTNCGVSSGEEHQDAEEGGQAERQESTLGVMLRKLGIAPETLGWNDEEEAFVDDECE
ncbi:hypothetical protein BJV77DRAFT_1064286 [Russula vinacea]|nr:hypothetical protein BJV77DRAFT_1064286 [Russula vinacea]